MKPLTILFIALLGTSAIMQEGKDLAKVEQYQGLYVFTDSKPIAEFEYLGTVNTSVALVASDYATTRDKLIKKAKKEYPGCEGIIIQLHSSEWKKDRADVIRFK